MKKNILLSLIVIVFLIACNRKSPTLIVTTDDIFEVESGDTINFNIQANSETKIQKFYVKVAQQTNCKTVFDSVLNTRTFTTNYQYIVPESFECLCDTSFMIAFKVISKNKRGSETFYTYIVNGNNPIIEKKFRLYDITDSNNNAGYLSLEKSKTYTPQEATNYAEFVDMAFYTECYGDTDFVLISPMQLNDNSSYGTQYWDTINISLFYSNNVSPEEYDNVTNRGYFLTSDFYYYGNNRQYIETEKIYSFKSMLYKGFIFIRNLDFNNNPYVDISVKYNSIQCFNNN